MYDNTMKVFASFTEDSSLITSEHLIDLISEVLSFEGITAKCVDNLIHQQDSEELLTNKLPELGFTSRMKQT